VKRRGKEEAAAATAAAACGRLGHTILLGMVDYCWLWWGGGTYCF